MDVFAVEAFAASWIEIVETETSSGPVAVEAFAASWIEIFPPSLAKGDVQVEAFAASWIEILSRCLSILRAVQSKPCGFVD